MDGRMDFTERTMKNNSRPANFPLLSLLCGERAFGTALDSLLDVVYLTSSMETTLHHFRLLLLSHFSVCCKTISTTALTYSSHFHIYFTHLSSRLHRHTPPPPPQHHESLLKHSQQPRLHPPSHPAKQRTLPHIRSVSADRSSRNFESRQ